MPPPTESFFSNKTTFFPPDASLSAATRPDGPPPTMATSVSVQSMSFFMKVSTIARVMITSLSSITASCCFFPGGHYRKTRMKE
jgi:hypothetical protein